MAGQPEVKPFRPCISCRFDWTRDSLSQVVASHPVMVRLTAACSFKLKMFKFSNRKGKARQYVAVWERYVFARFMSVCAKACVCARTGWTCYIGHVSSEQGLVWRDMRVPMCLWACFCGLNPRTAPQLFVNKFRAPLGYRRGLVRGIFFRSLGTASRGAQMKSTKRKSLIYNGAT